MIITSYFANHRKIKKVGLDIVSIARFSPKWMTDIQEMKHLAPLEVTLFNYKQNKDEHAYKIEYESELKNIDVRALEKECKGKVLCCYEKSGEFCHRHLLADYCNSRGVLVIELKDAYVINVRCSKGNEILCLSKVSDLIEELPSVPIVLMTSNTNIRLELMKVYNVEVKRGEEPFDSDFDIVIGIELSDHEINDIRERGSILITEIY